ncbi:MAG: hypothetical protein JWO89_3443 [Verrucomicrobiaceae bacterium]|nr:hypothetical protein [Verrucomicrobiaceae bacterium]
MRAEHEIGEVKSVISRVSLNAYALALDRSAPPEDSTVSSKGSGL